ncbi:MAG: hypothetical protein AAF542_25550 [Pseudomonadota bacterium]
MPFTPVHLGPAVLLKALLGANFSFVVFGGSQILIDLEPLVQLYRGASVIHGHSHSVLGAVSIGILATVLGKPIGQVFLLFLKYSDTHISWKASATGAFLGTFTHILIDGVMHSDMAPWFPFTTNNNLLGLVSVADLHYFCLGAGVLGLGLLGIQSYFKNNS